MLSPWQWIQADTWNQTSISSVTHLMEPKRTLNKTSIAHLMESKEDMEPDLHQLDLSPAAQSWSGPGTSCSARPRTGWWPAGTLWNDKRNAAHQYYKPPLWDEVTARLGSCQDSRPDEGWGRAACWLVVQSLTKWYRLHWWKHDEVNYIYGFSLLSSKSSPVLPDSRTSFYLYRESGPTQLTNINSLEGGCLLKFKSIGSVQCHSGSAITHR